MHWFVLFIGSLSTYRLSLLVSKEDGPAFIFRRLRRLPPAKSSAKEGLSCPWCVSVWASALVTWYLWHLELVPGPQTPLYWLSMSACSIFMNQQWTKG